MKPMISKPHKTQLPLGKKETEPQPAFDKQRKSWL